MSIFKQYENILPLDTFYKKDVQLGILTFCDRDGSAPASLTKLHQLLVSPKTTALSWTK